MPYPNSPFGSEFDAQILFKLKDDDENSTLTAVHNEELEAILKWLCTTPEVTTYRVNTLKADPEDVIKSIQSHILNVLGPNSIKIERHQLLKDVITLHSPKIRKHLEVHCKEIIVDVDCAAAVLRGAHIYAPGVLGMMAGIQFGDNVSIYADISKKCKRGQQIYDEHPKVFIANGVVKMGRYQLFSDNCPHEKKGIAVNITETISNCPSLGDDFLPPGIALLQNIPSIVCAYVLNPQPHDVILDMCASPGNKTTHIAALMKNQGKLIAIDKTPSKVKMLEKRSVEFGAKVEIFQADSTKLVEANSENLSAPPFPPNSFDRILLDGPCSALGKRPQLRNSISRKVLLSYRPLQKKLFENAVQLLKNNGVLVYSTCTLTLGENEGIVKWALNTFRCLELVKAEPIFGGAGLKVDGLEEDKLQRFGPQQVDSIGFFIAKFVKKQ